MGRKIATTTTTKNGNIKVEGYKPINGGAWITKERRLAIYIRDNFVCQYCGTDLRNITDVKGIALDHLVCRTLGGSNKSTNLITVCRSCNSKKSDKLYTEYASGGALDRIERQRYLPLNIALAKALIAGTGRDEETENQR